MYVYVYIYMYTHTHAHEIFHMHVCRRWQCMDQMKEVRALHTYSSIYIYTYTSIYIYKCILSLCHTHTHEYVDMACTQVSTASMQDMKEICILRT